jgi:hypothetical protein
VNRRFGRFCRRRGFRELRYFWRLLEQWFFFLHLFHHGSAGRDRFRRVCTKVPADGQSDIVVERARVSLLFGDSEFGQEIEYPAWLNLKLASQLVDPDLTHRQDAIFPR